MISMLKYCIVGKLGEHFKFGNALPVGLASRLWLTHAYNYNLKVQTQTHSTTKHWHIFHRFVKPAKLIPHQIFPLYGI